MLLETVKRLFVSRRIRCATLKLVKFVRQNCYSGELEKLQKLISFDEIGRVTCKGVLKNSTSQKLNPVVVYDVLRLGGR